MTSSEKISYLKTLPLECALWWFIENVNEETPGRTQIFFALRERVRNEAPKRPAGTPALAARG